MNRKERRQFDKKLQKAGFTEEQRKDIDTRLKIQREKLTKNPTTCWEGEKVKLDYNKIISYPDYYKLREEYRNFIESSKDKVFTVEFDTYKKTHDIKNKDSMVCLVEDETKLKWLFWAGDLVPISGQHKPIQKTEKEKYMEQIEDVINQVKDE